MKHFFISYNKADRPWAEWIGWQLEAADYSVVIQAWDFREGSNFVLEMQRAVEEAQRTMIVLSPDFLASQFTAPEWAAAFAKDPTGAKGLLLPVRVRDCNPTGLLAQINYIDLVGVNSREQARERLLTAVASARPKPTVEPELPRADIEQLHATIRAEPRWPPAIEPSSIAVLPFVNLSRNEEDEYFSDGLADELLNELAKIRRLRVAARTSSFHFKGKNPTIAEVGKALNVATVLEGSVRKSGNRVRISVQLAKVADGYRLWSKTYDRTLEDIFAVQDDIAQSVVKELWTTLLGEEADARASAEVKAEVAKAARGRGQNAEAHQLYVRARHLIDRDTREDVAKGIEYLQEALQLDPGSALAWAALGAAYAREAGYGWAPLAEGYGRAREAVERALSLEPDLAEGHAEMGWIRMAYDWDWRGAEASYRRALELAPGNAPVLRRSGALAIILGRVDDAIGQYRRAAEQDPLSALGYDGLGLALHFGDRLAEAGEAYRKALELAPQGVNTHASFSLVLIAQGRGEEALAEAMREPHEAFRLWALGIIGHAAGRGAESDEALRELSRKHAEEGACQIAVVHAARGEVDAAFEWLERAYAQRDFGLAYVKVSPPLRSLRADPRWGAFLSKMGLAD